MLLDMLKLNLYSEKCVLPADDSNVLHIVGAKGFTRLTNVVLSEGYRRLLWGQDSLGRYPVELCIKHSHNSTAAIMLKAMNDQLVTVA